MMEQYEKQYAASAAAHLDQSNRRSDRTPRTAPLPSKDDKRPSKDTEPEAGKRAPQVASAGFVRRLGISNVIAPRELKLQDVPIFPIQVLWKPPLV